MELQRLADRVYACLQEDRGLGYSNSGLVDRGGGLVIDTFWDLPHTRRMIDLYAGVRKAPIGRVLNTHANGDHCWGNQLFPGAELIGHRQCALHFRRENPAMMQMLKGAGDSSDRATAALARALDEWDFSGIDQYTAEPVPQPGDVDSLMQWYHESSHYHVDLGDRILDKIFDYSSPNREPADDFGVALTPDNIETHLSMVRNGLVDWIRQNPADVAEIDALLPSARTIAH